ncbi:MAG: nicotinate-nucleotide--dimethylbenzimidazole phosphoribosyltransferase [Desulfobacterales bacterium]|nr:nicotinate-nucleotide--dimethylbenzimidazole phosphoribosyltransferase [Desulfobacterales bacterium]
MSKDRITVSEIIEGIKPVDTVWVEKARKRTARLVIPPRALGRLHDISEQLCGIGKTLEPSIDRKAFLVMAGDHGVAAEGVSAFPQQVTGEMIRCFLMGGAGINILAGQAGADVYVVDMGIIPDLDPLTLEGGERLHIEKIAPGTQSFSQGPAMTLEQAKASVIAGFKHASALLEAGTDILGTGDMGIGNTTPSAAIGAVVTGASLDDMVGRGTGIDDSGLILKKKIIQKGIEINRPMVHNGLDILAKIGGFEIGGIAGVILAAAYHGKPVMIDGFISTAGALIAQALCPESVQYILAGHCSEEPGHRIMLDHLGLRPILDLGMRLGEGTGGALAMNIVEGAIRIFRNMLTFDQAGVSEGA